MIVFKLGSIIILKKYKLAAVATAPGQCKNCVFLGGGCEKCNMYNSFSRVPSCINVHFERIEQLYMINIKNNFYECRYSI